MSAQSGCVAYLLYFIEIAVICATINLNDSVLLLRNVKFEMFFFLSLYSIIHIYNEFVIENQKQ